MLFWVPLIVGLILKLVDPELFRGADQVGTILLWVAAAVVFVDALIIAAFLRSNRRMRSRSRFNW
jgi:hypothetical protein